MGIVFCFIGCPDMLRSPPPATPGSGIPLQIAPPPQQLASTPVEVSKWGSLNCGNEDNQDNRKIFMVNLGHFLQTSAEGCNILKNRPNFFVRCVWTKEFDHIKGGFFIRGEVSFENQALLDLKANSQTLVAKRNSYLETHILEAHTGQELIKPIGYPINIIETYINPPSSIRLVFEDNQGKVILAGGILYPTPPAHNNPTSDNQDPQNNNLAPKPNLPPMFSGQFEYENKSNCEGSLGGKYRGTIGNFRIPACGLFDCKK